jgi:hypothetical protein
MRVGIIRTGLRLSVRSDAGAIQPRLDVATLPYSPATAFDVALSAIVSGLWHLRLPQIARIEFWPVLERF